MMLPLFKKSVLALTCSLAGFAAGCNWEPLHRSGAPAVSAGEDGALPAVVDLRRSGDCPEGVASFTLRFSKPMSRANLENALSFSEILGDIRGATQPERKEAVLPDPKSFVWEDSDRQVTFKAGLIDYRMYTLKVALTVTDRTGKGLDGEVGADVDGDGAAEIIMDGGQYARVDDDYLRRPVEFTSLPFYLCDSSRASGIWRVPLNDSHPQVLEFAGLLPNNEAPVRYVPSAGYFPFGISDGVLIVQKPLPPRGVLRLQIASPNTAPTRGFAQQNSRAPVLPSTLTGNIEITDADERDYGAGVFLDDRLRLKAPLLGLAQEVAGNTLKSQALEGLETDILKGMSLVAQGDNGYVFVLPIVANSGDTITVDQVLFEGLAVRPDPILTFFFPWAKFRENEMRGLKMFWFQDDVFYGGGLIVEGNTANEVRIGGGDMSTVCPISSLSSPDPTFCNYRMEVDLAAMGFLGKSFEIVPTALFLHTSVSRPKGQIFQVRLNLAETPITDIYGRTFVDKLADGNDRDIVDNQWIGSFSSGDAEAQPIPPTLQLNDGRWYGIFATGSTVGASLTLSFGKYIYLGAGVMGRFDQVCQGSAAIPVLSELGLVFATPDGRAGTLGADDLLTLSTVNASNFGVYRLNQMQPQIVPAAVTGSTVQTDIFTNGNLTKRIPMTLVRLTPPPEIALVTLAGNDGICSTSDDQVKNKTRSWIAGDRLLLSHRIRHPKGDENSLDGNYDGVLEDNARDDMILEYQPASAVPFRRIP